MSFKTIIGNDKVKQFLAQTISEKHILHSYLFVGIQGIGKTLFAREFARQILCINNEDNEDCISCIKWKSENQPDFIQIEPDNGSIKIEQIRQMQERIAEKPIVSKRKVYIILDSETMTKEAQNCLLKTLEEPPEYATIILTTSNESKLLTTIKSRCIKVQFETINKEEIEKYIQQQSIEDIDKKLISMCEGSIGKLHILKDGKDVYERLNNLLDEIEKNDLITIFNHAEVLYKEKEKIQEILNYINVYFYHTKDIKKINCIKYVEEVKKRLLSNSNYDMCIDYLLIKIWEEINEKYNRSSI